MPASLLWLALGSFAIGTEALLIAGLLPTIAGDLMVSVATTGSLVTGFALTYAFGAPITAALTATLGRRALLLGCLILFALANLAAALAPAFSYLLAARVVMALAMGLYMPSAGALAGALVKPEQRGRALAIVTAGLTVAMALGVPFGTYVGTALGWRAAFIAVAILGGIAALGIAVGFPAVATPPAPRLRERLAPLGQSTVRRALLTTAAWTGGAFTLYTYLAVYMRDTVAIEGAGLALILALFGVGGLVGTLLGGWASDRFGPMRVSGVSLAVLVLAFSGLALAPRLHAELALPAELILIAVWSVAGWAVHPAQQSRLMALAPGAAPLLLALNASALYLGTAAGAALGGFIVAHAAVAVLAWAAAILEIGALLALATSDLRMPAPSRQLSGAD